jgi:hypothetical protein
MYDEDEWQERVERFADPGGDSALHPATAENPRNKPCGSCGFPNRLTQKDVDHGYHCDSCANALERGLDIYYYDGEEVSMPDGEGEDNG